MGGSVYYPLYTKKKTVKKDVEDEEKKIKNILEINDIFKSDYPIEKFLDMKFKDYFMDRKVGMLVVQIVVMLLYMTLTLDPIGSEAMGEKREFAVVTEDDQQYVIIYKNNVNCYLEEACITGDKIIIQTTKQKIISANDLNYENRKFETVVKMCGEEN